MKCKERAGQITWVYIYRDNILKSDYRGMFSPGKGFSLGVKYRKMGLGKFLGEGNAVKTRNAGRITWVYTDAFPPKRHKIAILHLRNKCTNAVN